MSLMKPRSAFLLGLWVLLVSTLACWSSDTLFIRPTDMPTATPVPPTQASVSTYQVGDTVVIVSEGGFAAVYLTREPEPVTRRNRVANAACYPNTSVTITAVQEVNSVTYYQVACNNTPGWVAEEFLGLP